MIDAVRRAIFGRYIAALQDRIKDLEEDRLYWQRLSQAISDRATVDNTEPRVIAEIKARQPNPWSDV